MGYVRLDHTVMGFHATLTNRTWPGQKPPNYSLSNIKFQIVKRGSTEAPTELPVRVNWPHLYVAMGDCPGELAPGYYEGWFLIGCIKTCKALFMSDNKLCFDLCPTPAKDKAMQVPGCDPDPGCDTCETMQLSAKYKTYKNGITLIFDSECIPEGCNL